LTSAAELERTAVDPEHYSAAFACGRGSWCIYIEIEAILYASAQDLLVFLWATYL